MTPPPPLLAVEALDAFYDRAHILQGVSFAVAPGEIVALLGRNGAGKSTLLKTLMGIVPPASGSIRLQGEEIAGRPAAEIARLGIGYVPQGRRLFPSLTVDEHLRMIGGRDGKRRWTPGRIYELFPRLAERKRNGGAQLSGGEQQMLAIGRALLRNPKLLVMDEPSEGLAPTIVADVGRTIAKLKAEGLSIVLVEQNIKLTLNLADDVVIINTGSVVFRGTPAELERNDAVISQHLGVF